MNYVNYEVVTIKKRRIHVETWLWTSNSWHTKWGKIQNTTFTVFLPFGVCPLHSLAALMSSQPTSCFAHELPFSVTNAGPANLIFNWSSVQLIWGNSLKKFAIECCKDLILFITISKLKKSYKTTLNIYSFVHLTGFFASTSSI